MHANTTRSLDPAAVQHKQLVKQTQKWVSQTFYGTILRQMRQSPFKSDVFSGGRGGQAFGEMLDQQLADHMSRSSGSKLTNAVVDKIELAQAKRNGMGLKKWRASHGIKASHGTRLNVRA